MFGRHKLIERFAVCFLSLFLLMSFLVGCIVIQKNQYDAQRLSTQAIYTTKVVTSRSHVNGNIVDVMVSEDRTKAFVFWKMESMKNMSSDAADYIMFLTGSTESQQPMNLKSQPSGGIYVFGVSGYMGAYLVNSTPFESQILNLVVRNIKDYSSKEVDGEANVAEVPAGGDSSFKTYDQMQIFFNPGGNGATHAEFLDDEAIDIEKMYEEAIVQHQKAEIRKTLQSDLQRMFELQRQMDKYEQNLTDAEKGVYGAVLAPMERPEAMKTDEIVAYTYDGDKELTWSDIDNKWIDSDGNTYDDGSYYLDLKTDYVFSGGYDFKWQKDVKGGYLDELRGTASVNEYLKQQQDAYNKAGSDGERDFDTSKLKFYYSDGSPFVKDVNSEDTQLLNLSEGVQQLTETWSEYFKIRVKFQTQDLKTLVYIERDASVVSSTYSENFAENALINY
jgi:hypothetical protein